MSLLHEAVSSTKGYFLFFGYLAAYLNPMKHIIFAFLFATNIATVFAQYNTQSQYFNEPELLIDYVNDCANFWEQTEDMQYGGYFMDISRSGNVLNTNKKGLVSLSRNAYGFSRAFMLTGDTSYLAAARLALTFMQNHLWDNTYEGWHATSQRNGSNPSTGNKSAFDQHYALLGLMAYWEATQDTQTFQSLNRGLNYIEQALWDQDPEQQGYFDIVNRSGQQASGKSFNATVDAITTHVWNLWLLTGDDQYRQRLLILRDNILMHMIPSMQPAGIGFAEEYNSNWTEKSSERRTIMGHVLKTAWSLNRIYKMTGDAATLEASKMLVDHVLSKGYDHEYGGPYKDYDRFTGEMYMYGAYDTAKAWWQMEQAITAGLLLWETTREVKYLKMADESLDFFMQFFVDPLCGEVYADRARDGGRVQYDGGFWDENKGSQGKAAYHSIETAYYSYLYSKLILQRDTATLYYYFEPASYDRSIRMNPLAVDFEKFQIASVSQDGANYTNYQANTRLLHLPANSSGIFKVKYRMEGLPDFIPEQANTLITDHSAYPNPFIDQLNIRFTLKKAASVNLKVFNSMGILIDQIEGKKFQPGDNLLVWNNPNASAGLYYYHLEAGTDRITGKCIVR